ncbi:PilZ domain-containing protein [Thiospirochaeta perfilievii]|uniref:PilZ domain-containing protein n=1 Tax=Thiospirochaeta perfilievii TaxID=252967 RepID=UPI001659E6AB|nr:PilZ domain-containing protein [Thiospirochaeta perfilievii]
MENRRINRRVKLQQLIEISYSNQENLLDANLEDISISGLRFSVNSPITTGSEIFLMFELPQENEGKIIKCYGEVLWQEKNNNTYIIGLKFKHLYRSDKEALESYLKNSI